MPPGIRQRGLGSGQSLAVLAGDGARAAAEISAEADAAGPDRRPADRH